MLKDDIEGLLNRIFSRGKIPLKISDMFLYRPVYHEPPFEDFEPINDAKRLGACDPLYVDFVVEHQNHKYAYHYRYKNHKGKFSLKNRWLKMCDIFPNEDPKVLEKNMEKNARFLSEMLRFTLELLSGG